MTTSDQEPLDLEVYLGRKSKPVRMRQADGTAKVYTLKEMTGDERDAYLNSVGARTKVQDGERTFKSFDGYQASLICRCLYDEAGEPVSYTAVKAWPASAQSSLFIEAQKLSALDDGGEAREKNS